MKKNICKNCKNFKPDEVQAYEREFYGDEIGVCKSENFIYLADGTHDKVPEKGLGYIDCEGYEAWFWVKNSFGCINFKK